MTVDVLTLLSKVSLIYDFLSILFFSWNLLQEISQPYQSSFYSNAESVTTLFKSIFLTFLSSH